MHVPNAIFDHFKLVHLIAWPAAHKTWCSTRYTVIKLKEHEHVIVQKYIEKACTKQLYQLHQFAMLDGSSGKTLPRKKSNFKIHLAVPGEDHGKLAPERLPKPGKIGLPRSAEDCSSQDLERCYVQMYSTCADLPTTL